MKMGGFHSIRNHSFAYRGGKSRNNRQGSRGRSLDIVLSSLLIVYVLEHSGDVNSSCGPFILSYRVNTNHVQRVYVLHLRFPQ